MRLLPFLALVFLSSGAYGRLREGERPPAWSIDDVNPLKDARDSKQVAVVALWKSSCRTCQIQAAKLYQWYQLLKEYKEYFKIVVVNQIGDDDSLIKLDRLSRKSFQLYQDNNDTGVWDLMKGEMGSLYIVNADGMLTKQFHGNETNLGKKNPKCKHVKKNAIIKELIKEIKATSTTTNVKADCNNEYSVRYRKVTKGAIKTSNKRKIKNRKHKKQSKKGSVKKNKNTNKRPGRKSPEKRRKKTRKNKHKKNGKNDKKRRHKKKKGKSNNTGGNDDNDDNGDNGGSDDNTTKKKKLNEKKHDKDDLKRKARKEKKHNRYRNYSAVNSNTGE